MAKHNKKRNTAFVYEALIKEATVSMLKGNDEVKKKTINLIKKYFTEGSPLRKELECYRSLTQSTKLAPELATRILKEAVRQRKLLDNSVLFKTQSQLIKDINVELKSGVFNNFVPNYKNLATIAQIFSQNSPPATQVMLENKVIEQMTLTEQIPEAHPEVDNVLYRKFVEKFNTKYDTELLGEQKELLSYYIASFADNATELKMFLNEEIGRLKEQLTDALTEENIGADNQMVEKTQTIIQRLNSFATAGISEKVLLTVLQTQQLVKEIYCNGDID